MFKTGTLVTGDTDKLVSGAMVFDWVAMVTTGALDCGMLDAKLTSVSCEFMVANGSLEGGGLVSGSIECCTLVFVGGVSLILLLPSIDRLLLEPCG